MSESVVASTARPISSGRGDRRLTRRHLLLLDEADDVLEHDDGVVDDDAYRQRQCEQGDRVEREALPREERERSDDGDRNRDRGDGRAAHVAEEEQHRDAGEDRAENEVLFDRVNAVADDVGAVLDDAQAVALGQALRDRVDALAHRVHDCDRALPGLLADREQDRATPVLDRDRVRIVHAVLDARDVAEAHGVITARAYDEALEVADLVHASLDPERDGLGPGLDRAARHRDVLRLERALDLRHREATSAQPHRVDPDVHLARRAAQHAHLADARRAFDAATDRPIGELGDLAHRPIRLDDDHHDRRRVAVDLADRRRLDAFGKIAEDVVDAVTHLLRRDVDVLVELELDHHARDTLCRDRAELLDTGDGVDRLLDGVRDVGLYLLGRSARVDRRDRHHREVDLREAVEPELFVADDADQEDREDDHRREDGALYTELCEPLHGVSLSSLSQR